MRNVKLQMVDSTKPSGRSATKLSQNRICQIFGWITSITTNRTRLPLKPTTPVRRKKIQYSFAVRRSLQHWSLLPKVFYFWCHIHLFHVQKLNSGHRTLYIKWPLFETLQILVFLEGSRGQRRSAEGDQGYYQRGQCFQSVFGVLCRMLMGPKHCNMKLQTG